MEYTDIRVVECNKKQSISATDINSKNGLYTNKLGENIQLKKGDKINVEYSFINEKGCGANTIEIEGKPLGVTKTFYETKEVKDNIIPLQNLEVAPPENIQVHNFTRTSRVTASLEPVTKMLRDDELNIPQYYYKTANGEGYMFLPRRFATADANLTDTKISNLWSENHWATMGTPSGQDNGVITYGMNQEIGDRSLCMNDYKFLFGWNTNGMFVPKTDNSKYTIMKRDITYPNIQYPNYAFKADYYAIGRASSPALRKYHKYTELNTIKVDKGYNSPQNIAKQITEQLQEQSPTEKLQFWDAGSPSTYRDLSEVTETRTWKTFNTATIGDFSIDNYTAWVTNTDTNAEILKSATYDKCYENVGFLRPDLRVLGQATMELIEGVGDITSPGNFEETYGGSISLNNNAWNVADQDTLEVITSWEWNETNRKALRDLFVAQGKYPEIWSNDPYKMNRMGIPGAGNEYKPSNDTIRTHENSRFLHVNIKTTAEQDILGGDGMIGTPDPVSIATNRQSIPLFFYCDPQALYIDGDGSQFTTEHIAFGCMNKRKVGDKYYITLWPGYFADGIRHLFKLNGGISFALRTICLGWDSHFTSYGNVAMALLPGYTPFLYNEPHATGNDILLNGEWGVQSQVIVPPGGSGSGINANPEWNRMNKVFLGGSNCACVFGGNGHFYFEYLHEPERHGQGYDAGENPDPTRYDDKGVVVGGLTNPILTEAPDEVYKINKLLGYWNWSPDYAPYTNDPLSIEFGKEASGGGAVKPVGMGTTTIQRTNPRIEEYSIMDAICGLFMDLGQCYTKETWEDGVLGIMGFTYEQYNPEFINDNNNLQSRVTYENNFNLQLPTTNCDIVATEQDNYIMNRYGGIQFGNQVSMPLMWRTWVDNITPGATRYALTGTEYQLPNIQENTTSFQIGAEELPRKMLRPYFTIRSDIITDDKYIGGNTIIPGDRGRGGGIRLPIVAIVNKENGDGDFYFSVESPLQYTITKDTMVSSITTSIHNPDQSLVEVVGDECCIMYKISRERSQDPNIAEEIMGIPKKKSK